MKKKLKICGPMKGYKDFNYPAFNKAAAELRAEGFYVFNPAEADRDEGTKLARRAQFAADIAFIANDADAIVLLPGWREAAGARAEKAIAEVLGLGVIYLNTGNKIVGYENLASTGLQGDLFDQVRALYADTDKLVAANDA